MLPLTVSKRWADIFKLTYFLCEAAEASPSIFFMLICQCFWVNYNELTTSSLEIMVSKGNHPQMALIQVSELL